MNFKFSEVLSLGKISLLSIPIKLLFRYSEESSESQIPEPHLFKNNIKRNQNHDNAIFFLRDFLKT